MKEMIIVFILILMLFCHVVDDYYLQGVLASMKQKEWWQKNAPQKIYRFDYIIALITHSFSWAFMIMLPLALYAGFNISALWILLLGANFIIHSIVDDLKANKKKINLIVDQSVHIAQIVATFVVWIIVG